MLSFPCILITNQPPRRFLITGQCDRVHTPTLYTYLHKLADKRLWEIFIPVIGEYYDIIEIENVFMWDKNQYFIFLYFLLPWIYRENNFYLKIEFEQTSYTVVFCFCNKSNTKIKHLFCTQTRR